MTEGLDTGALATWLDENAAGLLDGVRADYPDGFGLVRASNTTPVLVMRFEGQTQAALERIESEMLTFLKTVKPDATIAEAAH